MYNIGFPEAFLCLKWLFMSAQAKRPTMSLACSSWFVNQTFTKPVKAVKKLFETSSPFCQRWWRVTDDVAGLLIAISAISVQGLQVERLRTSQTKGCCGFLPVTQSQIRSTVQLLFNFRTVLVVACKDSFTNKNNVHVCIRCSWMFNKNWSPLCWTSN